MMEFQRRKFKSDISNKSIDALLNKRQRKRFHQKKNPYEEVESQKSVNTQVIDKNGPTVIKSLPHDMLPKNKLPQKVRREYEKPEHWIMPKAEAPRSRADVFENERVNIAKLLDERSTWDRAAKMLATAKRQPLRTSTSNLTAKGYIEFQKVNAKNPAHDGQTPMAQITS